MGDTHTYKVSPKGAVGGIAIYWADPAMQAAYRSFISDGIGMGEFLPFPIYGEITEMVSPLSRLALKTAAGIILPGIVAMAKKNDIKRVACIVRRQDIETPLVRHFVNAPFGKDFVIHVMSLAREILQKKLGMDVEVYLAEVNGEDVEFYKLDIG